ncbi:MAG: hypothetical protein G3W67_24025, partial [Xanthomonas perforans]|nr:hypothetical protein [Xanthomonas perforans]
WSWRWLSNLGLVLVATFWLLFFVYSHVEYSNDLWWEFATSANAPRALRAALILCVGVIVFGMARLLRGGRRPMPSADAQTLQTLAPILAISTDTQACL